MKVDGRQVRGDASRRTILEAAMQLASVEGLGGLSIGTLAAEVSMSKAGIVGLFGSKERLQLAVIHAASLVFRDVVITPALEYTGRARLLALTDGWIDYSRRRVFRGGCFFAAVSAEFRSMPGDVRDAITASLGAWEDFLESTIARAIERGEISADVRPRQAAFEITALLDGANAASLLHDTEEPYAMAREAITRVLPAASPGG